MKKILTISVSLLCLFISSVQADIEQGQVNVELSIPQIIQLDVLTVGTKIMPGPEDYARDLQKSAFDGGNKFANPDTGKGFAERNDAIEITLFTNARNGAALYVHGIQPPGPQGILRLEDTYLTVQTDKTYILHNNLEGSFTNYKTNNNGNTYWLRLDNEAQEIFKVGVSTKDPRLIVFNLGLGNLSGYTTGNYKNTIIFSLVPVI